MRKPRAPGGDSDTPANAAQKPTAMRAERPHGPEPAGQTPVRSRAAGVECAAVVRRTRRTHAPDGAETDGVGGRRFAGDRRQAPRTRRGRNRANRARRRPNRQHTDGAAQRGGTRNRRARRRQRRTYGPTGRKAHRTRRKREQQDRGRRSSWPQHTRTRRPAQAHPETTATRTQAKPITQNAQTAAAMASAEYRQRRCVMALHGYASHLCLYISHLTSRTMHAIQAAAARRRSADTLSASRIFRRNISWLLCIVVPR